MNEENTQNSIENAPIMDTPVTQSTVPPVSNEPKKLSMPVAILLAGVIIALAVLFSGRTGGKSFGMNTGGKINVKDAGDIRMMEPVTKNDHIRGDLSKAKIAVVEFSDLQCPYCKQINPMLVEMSKAYGNNVAWVYRDFPLESIHPRARISAHGAECVADVAGNDGFWKYVDGIFGHTGTDDPLSDENLSKFASAAGMDANAFSECQKSGKFNGKIDNYLADASSSGAQGTPDVTVINLKTGEAVHAGADPKMLAQVIEKMSGGIIEEIVREVIARMEKEK